MAAKFNDLVEYFEMIAREHVAIAHTDAEKHFYRFELNELLDGIMSKIKYPALNLEGYDFSYSESSSDNIRKRRSGAFWIIGKVKDIKDYDAVQELLDDLEEIGEDILVRMKADKESRLVPVLRDFNIGECEGVPLRLSQMDTGSVGIRFSFSMVSGVNGNVNAAKWQTSPGT